MSNDFQSELSKCILTRSKVDIDRNPELYDYLPFLHNNHRVIKSYHHTVLFRSTVLKIHSSRCEWNIACVLHRLQHFGKNKLSITFL